MKKINIYIYIKIFDLATQAFDPVVFNNFVYQN